MKGQYVLFITLRLEKDIRVGKLGTFHFPKGDYAYVGSALKGIEGRVERHLRKAKKKHWHIDYFLVHARVVGVEFYPSMDKREECRLAKQLGDNGRVIVDGFGSSDCSCKSHLFYFGEGKKSIEFAHHGSLAGGMLAPQGSGRFSRTSSPKFAKSTP